jgi:hypothetical protein
VLAAVRAAGLGDGFTGDPADRFIVAAALEMGAILLTGDQNIDAWGGVEVLWRATRRCSPATRSDLPPIVSEFVQWFPGVTEDQVRAVLEPAARSAAVAEIEVPA